MPIVVSDTFNRPDDPTGLGTADTGQVWVQETGDVGQMAVVSNRAKWVWVALSPDIRMTIESGVVNGSTSVTLVDPTTYTNNFGIGIGIIFRWVSDLYYWQLVYYKFPGPTQRLRLQRHYNSGTPTTHIDYVADPGLNDGDIIKCTYCGPLFEIFVNGVSVGTYDDSFSPQNYGTKCGLRTDSGSYFAEIIKNFDDFLVETDVACPNPGADWTLPALEWSAEAGVRRPSGGTLTQRFDAGNGNAYYLIPQLSDSGIELRDKVIKAVRVTGKVTNANFKVYGWGATEEIDVEDVEAGTNSRTGAVALPDTTDVEQSPRSQVNVPNSALHTVRIEGEWDGEGIKDRIDEVSYEVAEQGVRR